MPCRGAPNEDCDNLSVFENELPEAISSFFVCPKKVFFIQKLVSEFPVRRTLEAF